MNVIILRQTPIYLNDKRGAVCLHLGEEGEVRIGVLKVGSIYRASKLLVDHYRIQESLGTFFDFMLLLNNKRKMISICHYHLKELDGERL